ncbi:MAG: hypothetical protein HWN66_20400 [Candidatus Helarchaeota archaeon]|nr:hypothetical protein [Candidatus Helarchaeota archaeon]
MRLNKVSLEKTSLFAVRLFGYAEILILFGIQLFWIIYSGDLLYHESLWDLFAFIGPIVVTIIVGILCQMENYRAALRKIEWILHLLICAIILSIMVLIQIRDEFNPSFPFTWLFHLWIVFFGLVLTVNMVSTTDKPSLLTYLKEKKQFLLFVGGGAIIWILTLGLISLLYYPVHYWITAAIFHAIMIPISLSQQYTNSEVLSAGPPSPYSYRVYKNSRELFSKKAIKIDLKKFYDVLKGVFLGLLFMIAWFVWGHFHGIFGSIEANYHLVVGIFISPLFYVGLGVGIGLQTFEVKKSVKITLIGDTFGFFAIGLSLIGIHSLAPFALGYALVMLLLHESSQNPISYASAIIFIQFLWYIALALFVAYPSIITLEPSINRLINIILFGAIGGALGLCLGCSAIENILRRRKEKSEQEIENIKSKQGTEGYNSE